MGSTGDYRGFTYKVTPNSGLLTQGKYLSSRAFDTSNYLREYFRNMGSR